MQAAGQGVLLPERSPLQKFIVNRGLRQHLLPAVFRSGQGEPLPSKLIRREGRGGEACWAGRTPAEQAYKERWQGGESKLGRESPCRASLYGKRAGEEKLVGQGERLPDKLIRKEGRGGKACWAGRAPAEQAYMERRQGRRSLLGRESPCRASYRFGRHSLCQKLRSQESGVRRKLRMDLEVL